MKVHAKICLIRKRLNDRIIHYGFVSTGNLNENTSKVYADHCLLTSNRNIMSDVNRLFNYIEHYKTGNHFLKACTTLIPSPVFARREIMKLIQNEIKIAKKGKQAAIIAKMNSLSDEEIIAALYDAARQGVEIKLIIRGVFCMLSENEKFIKPVTAVSIVDEYLEHARVWVFHNGGKEKVFISSADWMLRNLDHRVEASCPILDERLKQEIKDILNIQLQDNVKARWLDNNLSNDYVRINNTVNIRSQVETYNYLHSKIPVPLEISSD
jgi:polyphosphate kinase